jgi:hypothetical protein
MKSPFKFLDAYDVKDKDVFFGRDDEIADLYEMVNQNRLILVYGQSGTGKTSLVRCGLAGRFDITDWYPILIRRRDDINASFKAALTKALEGDLLETYAESIEELYALNLRPVYLIFDQLEEIFTERENEAEQIEFIETIAGIYRANLPCRILFIIREEYLGHLYNFEKIIPTLFDRRLRVEPMNYGNVSKVITKSCNKFNITLENKEEAVRQIIESISDKKSGIQLPYLQVYLDMFYREDFERTYPEGSSEELPPLTFELREIDDFGAIGNVMKKFLDQQEKRIMKYLGDRYTTVPEDAVQRILDPFVTLDGTKRPIAYHMEGERLVLEGKVHDRMVGIDEEMLRDGLDQLERSRILRKDDDSFELAHDSLAALIEQQRSGEQRQLNEIRLRLQNIHKEHITKEGPLLNAKQLNEVEEYLEQLDLDEDLAKFVKDSHAQVKWEKRKKRNTRIAIAGSILLFGIVMAISALFSYRYYLEAEDSRILADSTLAKLQANLERQRLENFERYFGQGLYSMDLGDYEKAITQFDVALTFDTLNEDAELARQDAQELFGLKILFDTLMLKGVRAMENNDLVAARESFEKALNDFATDDNSIKRAETKMDEARIKMMPAFRTSVDRAFIFYEAEDCSLARSVLRRAQRLQPYLRKRDIERELKKIEKIKSGCR